MLSSSSGDITLNTANLITYTNILCTIVWNVTYIVKCTGEYNLTPLPPSGGEKRNQKAEIREENSKLMRKRRD